jgi:Methyltransferase domain
MQMEPLLINEKSSLPISSIQGWTSELELNYLHNFAKLCNEVVEVGSWKGRSTQALLLGCKGTVYAVDHFKGSTSESDPTFWEAKRQDIHSQFMQNLGHFENLVVLKGESCEHVKRFDSKSVDMVFLDGNHEYGPFKDDLQSWMPKAHRFLVGHDLNQGGVKQALLDLKIDYVDLKTEYGLWYVQV